MYKYYLSWTNKDGSKVDKQLFTAEHISHKLIELERSRCTSIKVEQLSEDEVAKISSSHGV